MKLPDIWQNCLVIEDSKKDLVNFLSMQLSMANSGNGCELVISAGFYCCEAITTTLGNHDISSLSSTQEGADTRIVLHMYEASSCGYGFSECLKRH